jgi:hypothetical protein
MLESIKPGESISSRFWPPGSPAPPREIRQIVDDNDSVALAAVARGMVNVNVAEDSLRANRVPILGMFGEHDPHRAEGTAMRGITRNFTMQIVPGLDHDTLAGSETFRGSIRTFIANVVDDQA